MIFSIIVPVFNVQDYIERCVLSLINQTYKEIEIILVDDGSTDNSSEICDILEKKDSRITVIHKENGGLSDARNAGLKQASGKYVLFVDSDDYISINTCEKFLHYIEFDCDIIIGDAIVIGGKCNLSHSVKNDIIYDGKDYLLHSLKNNKSPNAAWLNLYNRNFLINNNLFFKYGILHEDEQFTPRALLKAKRVVYTNFKFYYYVIRENSITTKKDKRKNAQDLYDTFCELENIYLQLSDKKLKKLLLDTLVEKYLNIFQLGELYKYGNEFIHKKFLIKNAHRIKTKMKVLLYSFSPILYWNINYGIKKMRGKYVYKRKKIK